MKNDSASDELYVKMFNWNSNPFTFNIYPHLFTGYQNEINKILDGFRNGTKFSILIGPTGSGKTTLIRHLLEKTGCHTIFLPKPPNDAKDFSDIFVSKFGKTISERFSRKNVGFYNITEYVNKKLNGGKCILFVDECHEASNNTLEWIRTITDQIDNLHVVFSGLPVFEKMLSENLESLMRRISMRIELGNLNKSETRDLIKRRIENAGGDDVKPFTLESIEYIYEKTGGFPREVIRMCSDIIQMAMQKNISIIDVDFLGEETTAFRRTTVDTINEFPQKQKIIIETLAKSGDMTPGDIVKKTAELKGYKNRDNAVRSVNNLLKRLMKDNIVIRKKRGKAFTYSVSPKMKTLFAKS